jgi:hypothetical protein
VSRNPDIASLVWTNVRGRFPRRLAVSTLVGAIGLACAAYAAPAHAAGGTTTATLPPPDLAESCAIPAFAFVHYSIKSGHAISGTWTLAPHLACNHGKTKMSISTTLKRNGAGQFSSAGSCQSQGLKLCKSAAGPRRSKSYATGIRGTWTAAVTYHLTGPDAIFFCESSPLAGKCSYDAVKFTASCHYDTAPVVIR